MGGWEWGGCLLGPASDGLLVGQQAAAVCASLVRCEQAETCSVGFGLRRAWKGDVIFITKYELCVWKGNEQKCTSGTLIFPPKWHFLVICFLSVNATYLQITSLKSYKVSWGGNQDGTSCFANFLCTRVHTVHAHEWDPQGVLTAWHGGGLVGGPQSVIFGNGR